MTGLF